MKYDIAISFAGDDRNVARAINKNLKMAGISTFYDEDFKALLWGKSLSEELRDIYYKDAKYCLMIVSRHYIKKSWPSHERKSALSRLVREKTEYILPYIIDDTPMEDIPGLPPDMHYLHISTTNPIQLVDIILTKIRKNHSLLQKFRHEECGQFLIKQIHRRMNPTPSDKLFSPPFRSKLLSDFIEYKQVDEGTEVAKNLINIFGTVLKALIELGYIQITERGELGEIYKLTPSGFDLHEKIRSGFKLIFEGYRFVKKP